MVLQWQEPVKGRRAKGGDSFGGVMIVGEAWEFYWRLIELN
jgi:hypothetical protein